MTGDELSIDIDVVSAAQIVNTVSTAFANQACVMPGDLGMSQNDRIIRAAPDGDFRVAEFDRMHRRQFFLRYRAAIVVGNCHKGAILIANTEDVAVLQSLAKRFVAPDLASLIEQTVQRVLALRVRVDKDKLVALA